MRDIKCGSIFTISNMEVLPADETSIHIQIRQGDGAETLKIKIQDMTIDCIEIMAIATNFNVA